MTINNKTLNWRVEQLEKTCDKIECKLDTVMENHLPHLQQQIEANKTTLKIATAINVGAIIFGIILSRII